MTPGAAEQQALIAALQLRAQGALRDAATAVLNLLGQCPQWADAHAAMAVLCADLGVPESALSHATRAVQLEPAAGRHHANRLALAERYGQQAASLRLVLLWTQQCPDDAQAWRRFTALLVAGHDIERAWFGLNRAEALAPGNAEVLALRGDLLLATGRPVEARAALERAVLRAPAQQGWRINLAVACLRLDDAAAALVVLQPVMGGPAAQAAAAADLRATALRRLMRPDDALVEQRLATSLMPTQAGYWHNLGIIHRDRADVVAALAAFDHALALAPDQPKIAWARALAEIPAICADEQQVDSVRAKLVAALDHLSATIRLDSPAQIEAWRQAAGSMQAFHAAYHGRADLPVQSRLGALIRRIMLAVHPWASTTPPMPPRRSGKLVVAIASAHVYDHSVWKIPLRGWLEQLDRRRFAIDLYHLGGRFDAVTRQAMALADQFIHSPGDEAAAVAALRANSPHVLLLPEIGMDPAVLRLAALPLAPVQAMGLGHPVTSGLPSVRWYLTSAAMQTADSDALFGETLVRLPGIGTWYAPPDRPKLNHPRRWFGLPESAVLLLSPQSLFKYQPGYDALLARIAAGAPHARLVFLCGESAAVTALFQQRLARAFSVHGLDWQQHCLFVPRQSGEGFQRLCEVCDVFLDSVGWSGFNTACEAAAAGLPILTWPGSGADGAQTHARHAAAVLTQMGLTELIAGSVDAYVEMAIALATDAAARARAAARVRAAVPLLWRDPSPVRALEDWIEQAVEEAGGV